MSTNVFFQHPFMNFCTFAFYIEFIKEEQYHMVGADSDAYV